MLRQWIARLRFSPAVVNTLLIVLIVLFLLGMAAQGVTGFLDARAVSGRVNDALAVNEELSGQADAAVAAYAETLDALKENGIFCTEVKKPKPPTVTGILGDAVLLDDKWCSVGDEHAGAKILAIAPTEVTILWNGKEMKLSPLLAAVPGGSGRGKHRAKVSRHSAKVTTGPQGQSSGDSAASTGGADDPLAWLGMPVSAELRAFLLKLFELMPAEHLERAKEEWANLSDDEKQQRLDEAQEMVDSGQADVVLEHMESQ